MRVIELRGDHYERGYQLGAAFSSEIRSFYTQMLGASLLPYMNREQPDIEELLPAYGGEEYGDGRFSYQLMLDSGMTMLDEMPPQYGEELQGVADGSGVPFEHVLIMNTYFDTMLALRSITFFIRGMQAPRLVSVYVEGGLDDDGVDNDGDGEIDEEAECDEDQPWDAPAHAAFVEVPLDASIRFRLEDTDALGEFAGTGGGNGEGVNRESIRIQYNTTVLEHDDPQLDFETVVDEEGLERLEVIFTPEAGFEPASVVSLILQAGDLSWITEPPPAHARNSRDERVVFTTEGFGEPPQEVENRGELDGRTQPIGLGFALRDSATPDGRTRLGYHFAMLDINSAHKHTVVAVHHPLEGEPYVILSWTGIIWGLTGMNTHGLAFGANSSDTLDNGMVIDILANIRSLDQARLVVGGVPMGILGREILSRCSTIEEAVEILRDANKTFGWNVILADGDNNLGSIEMDSDILGAGNGFHQLEITDEGPHRTASVGPDDLIMSCQFISNINDFDLMVLRPQRFWSSFYNRSLRTHSILRERISERYGTLDTPTIAEMMRDPDLVDQRDSMIAVIYEPEDLVFNVAMGQVPATDSEFVRFDLNDFLGGGER